jgi:eukaryotic-like serine/threonine-protein kinase
MGVVYEVEHLHTGQRLALKLMAFRPGVSADRFKREARAITRVRSEHVVQVTDAGVASELGGAPFLVMELLEGADLERVSGDRATPPEAVVEWLRQVARALTKAHEAGIVHRDLKPENLFLTKREDGSPLVKVLDFGVAKVAAESSALTTSGSMLGTPRYMAPEQTDSRGAPVTFRTDLYALGLIAFKLLTGRIYWRDGSLAQLLSQILADPMPSASERGAGFGPSFDAWFERACCRDPERRFDSATTQVEALATALGIAPAADVLDGSASREARTARGATRRGTIMAGGALATLAIVAVAWWGLARPAHPAGDPASWQRPATAAPPPASGASPPPKAIGVDAGSGDVPITTSPSGARPAKRPAAPSAASAPTSSGVHGPADPLEGPW